MSFMQSLNLTQNTFTGEIPPSLGQLRHLQHLYLNNNTLQGKIPSFTKFSKLRVLHLAYNNLVGQFPTDLLPLLQNLQVLMNNLTGTIPASLANIATLKVITCAYNHITGNIPNEFADLSSLQYLYVGANLLTGRFPQAILNLSTLISLSLTLNGLSGEVPPNLCTTLLNLQVLELGANFFMGNIPSSFTNASGLSGVDFSENNFTGLVPTMIGTLTKLSWLNLANNQLQANSTKDWEFLDSLVNCTKLQSLSIQVNRLSGNVPSSLCNLSNQLQFLDFAANQISGAFPLGIENLSNLFILSLAYNHFTGVLPEWIGTLKNLQYISLYKNFFTGVIPSSLSNLSSLGGLFLNSNQFTGHIPPSLGNLSFLDDLVISNNNLQGRVLIEIFRIPTIYQTDLSFNNLNEQLPTTIGNAKHLVFLLLSSNKLSGDIQNTLGDCESLVDLELASNIFGGSIPSSLGHIISLEVLNLSANNLTGSIPASLGNLQFLEKLDLSFNNLHGDVPTKGVFNNATALWIDGNKRLCGGVLELHRLACSVMPSNSSRNDKSLVLKVVIPIASMVSLSTVIFGLFIWRRKQKRNTISLPSFATKFHKVSFNDLAKATHGFSQSNLVGRGRYSSVYRGKLDGQENEVAVKVFNLERGAQKSFTAECNALRNVRHRNLVPILTACSSIDSSGNDFKTLVYEFMPHGDLHKLLYSTQDSEGSPHLNLLTMGQRMNIVVDVADAMEYLHHGIQGTMVHCDLKPSNILLDANMTAHVADFDLAIFKVGSTSLSLGNPNSSSVGLKGTIGYAAPEYAEGGQVSTIADVYSFGVVLLEIFLRRRPTDEMFKDGLGIVNFTEINFHDRVLEIIDPELLQELVLCQETPMSLKEKGVHSLLNMLDVGLCCTKTSPRECINMQEVAAKLRGIREEYVR